LVDLTTRPFADPHGGGADLNGAGVEVDCTPGQAAGLADAQAGCHEEGDEVGHIPGDGPIVVAERGPQLAQLGNGQRARCGLGPALDATEVFHGVMWECVVAGGQCAHPGQHRPAHSGGDDPVGVGDAAQVPVQDADAELADP
jgi:hypothetical protein